MPKTSEAQKRATQKWGSRPYRCELCDYNTTFAYKGYHLSTPGHKRIEEKSEEIKQYKKEIEAYKKVINKIQKDIYSIINN
jgi:hypothetical protein